ncbi:hypothetical protein AB1N83_013774, partial [Pleurotus pulmonarius]
WRGEGGGRVEGRECVGDKGRETRVCGNGRGQSIVARARGRRTPASFDPSRRSCDARYGDGRLTFLSTMSGANQALPIFKVPPRLDGEQGAQWRGREAVGHAASSLTHGALWVRAAFSQAYVHDGTLRSRRRRRRRRYSTRAVRAVRRRAIPFASTPTMATNPSRRVDGAAAVPYPPRICNSPSLDLAHRRRRCCQGLRRAEDLWPSMNGGGVSR